MKSVSGNTQAIFWFFITFFSFLCGFLVFDESYFFSREIDGGIIFLLAILGTRNNIPFFQSFFLLCLSRQIHLDSLKEISSFPMFYCLSWVVWGGVFVSQADHERAAILGLYHAGLSFDPGRVASYGMGMSLGWDSAELQFFLIAPLFRRDACVFLFRMARENRLAIGAFLSGLFWILIFHGFGSTSHFSLRVTCFAACLFLTVLSITPQNRFYALSLFLFGALPICFCALGEAFIEGESLRIIVAKRLFTGGLHPNLFGATAAFFLLFLLGNIKNTLLPQSQKNVLFLLFSLVFLTVLILSGARGALLIFGFGSLFFWFFKAKQTDVLFIVGVITVILFVSFRTVGSSGIQEWTNNERFYIWKSCLPLLSASLWKGYGIFAFGSLPQNILPSESFFTYDWNYPHSHNLVIEVALSGGIPLLLLSLCCIFIALRRMAHQDHGEFLVFSGMLLYGMLDFVLFVPSLLSFFIFLLCHPLNVKTFESTLEEKIPARSIHIFWFFLFLSCVGFCFENCSEKAFENSLTLLRERNPNWVAQADRAEALHSKNLQISLQRLFLRWTTKAAKPLQDEGKIRQLISDFPQYYLLRFIFGRICMQMGLWREALIHFSHSVELEPRDTSGIRWAYVTLMKRHLQQDYSQDLIMALSRGSLGQALLLDHPERGHDFFNTFLQTYPNKSTFPKL